MNQLFIFPSAVKRDPAVENWMHQQSPILREIAGRWFDRIRNCGDDVRELMHDGHPTACVVDAAFAYVNAFTSHVNVGFFRGAELADPKQILLGTGKLMRHVKLGPGLETNEAALQQMIVTAYNDMQRRKMST